MSSALNGGRLPVVFLYRSLMQPLLEEGGERKESY